MKYVKVFFRVKLHQNMDLNQKMFVLKSSVPCFNDSCLVRSYLFVQTMEDSVSVQSRFHLAMLVAQKAKFSSNTFQSVSKSPKRCRGVLRTVASISLKPMADILILF